MQTSLQLVFILAIACRSVTAQMPPASAVELGSRTAKSGFRNEDEIRDKFNNWKSDVEARHWLKSMGYSPDEILEAVATKPHAEKADVEVRIRTKAGEQSEGISIKLVSSANGFNQVDKRWVDSYAKLWRMPTKVVDALKLYVGESPPVGPVRRPERTYLDEMPQGSQDAVIDFFAKHKREIISDLLAGDGEHKADWFMVTFKNTDTPRWRIRSLRDTVRFYSEGDVTMTRYGNLKIGRVSMQRKGGDNGRETAKMLQFKINPVHLFDAK